MLVLGKFNGGTTPAKISSVLGTTKKNFRQLTLLADAGNSGSLYFGGSNVTSVPANEKLKLAAGVKVEYGPRDGARPLFIDTEALYVVGSAASQVLWVSALLDDGT